MVVTDEMSPSWKQFCHDQIQQLERQQLRRNRGGAACSGSTQSAQQLDFGSNDYLGLRRHAIIGQALHRASQSEGWGSGASPVLSGYTLAHQQLEALLATLSNTEDCLVFSSGFACNAGVLACLSDEQTLVLSDELNHASLIDGIRLGKSRKQIYRHCDIQDMKSKLMSDRHRFVRCLIVTESVFSMDGDEAPLREIVELSEHYDCGLVVDEAHAVGVFGQHGGGLLEELGLSSSVMVKLGTLSKALGGIGGYAAGSSLLVETLVNRCRSYLFSTAPPPAAMIASCTAVELLRTMQAERAHLREISCHARRRLSDLGWPVLSGRSPIIPVIVGSAERALELSQKLRAAGVLVPAIRPPTVPADTCRLRISLTALHGQADIQRLCSILGNA